MIDDVSPPPPPPSSSPPPATSDLTIRRPQHTIENQRTSTEPVSPSTKMMAALPATTATTKTRKIQNKKKLMEDLMLLREKLEKAKQEVKVRKGRLQEHLETGSKEKKNKKKKKLKSGSKSVGTTWTEDTSRVGGGGGVGVAESVKSEVRLKKVRTVRKVTAAAAAAATTTTTTTTTDKADGGTTTTGWTNPFAMISDLVQENGILTDTQGVLIASPPGPVKTNIKKTANKASDESSNERVTSKEKTLKTGIHVKKKTKKSSIRSNGDATDAEKQNTFRSVKPDSLLVPAKQSSSRSLDPRMLSPTMSSSSPQKSPTKRKSKKKSVSSLGHSPTDNEIKGINKHESVNLADATPVSQVVLAETKPKKKKNNIAAGVADKMNDSGDLSSESDTSNKKKVQEVSTGITLISASGSLPAVYERKGEKDCELHLNREESRSSVLQQSANSSFSSIPSPVTPAGVKREKMKTFQILPSLGLLVGIDESKSSDTQFSPSSKASASVSSFMTPPTNESLPAGIDGTTRTEDTTPRSIKAKKELFERLFQKKPEGPLPSIATPAGRRRRGLPEVLSPPQKLKGGFVELNLATPIRSKKKPAPKRIVDNGKNHQDRAQGYIDSACSILEDESKKKEVCDLICRIDSARGFPVTKRLSLRDNELVSQMVMVIRNDPSITTIEVAPDSFGTISSTLLEQFIDSLRLNLHLKKLTFSGVELGNDFLYSLATSMESNFVLEEIDLSRNLFTNAGLADFCQALATSNETCRKLILENQTTPISVASEEDVLDAFRQNNTLTTVKLDFQSEQANLELQKIITDNLLSGPPAVDTDNKLLNVLRYEAERAEELFEERQEDESAVEISEEDWKNLYDLSILFDKRKLNKFVQQAAENSFIPATQRRNADGMSKAEKKDFLFGAFKKNMEESVSCFNSDGSFLTPEFINKYLKEDKDEDSLTFDFHGQWKLFKRFPVHDPNRSLIVTKFVDALITHPRGQEITGINMANTGCGDDFLITLADRCLDDGSCLPNLYMINFETNFINEPGIVALSTMIASPVCMKYLQVVRLENQKGLLKSRAEFVLAKSMRTNYSVVVMSLRIRNLMERQQINKYVVRNVEYLRQARQRHFKATGQQRERNQVEQVFDKVAENDPSITEVNMFGNKRFLTLTVDEKIKAARAFSKNIHVKSLNLNSCGIDDHFVTELADSLKSNNTLKRISLEGNNVSGEGITILFEALSKNSSIEELRLHKQSKVIPTTDEHSLADILGPNKTLTRLGIDLRTQAAQVQVDRVLKLNRNRLLKERAESMGEDYVPNDVHTVLKF